MSTELANKKADAHFCVALRHKVRIRLHPSMALDCRIVFHNQKTTLPLHNLLKDIDFLNLKSPQDSEDRICILRANITEKTIP